MTRLIVDLMGKPGCHLCDDARVVVNSVLQDFPQAELVEHNILDDAELFETLKDDIPVVLINGERHAQWRVDEGSFRSALIEELT
jgi:hypothetical protein